MKNFIKNNKLYLKSISIVLGIQAFIYYIINMNVIPFIRVYILWFFNNDSQFINYIYCYLSFVIMVLYCCSFCFFDDVVNDLINGH